MKGLLLIVATLSVVPALSGCIAWEIRDDIRETNRHLCEVKPALVHTLHAVEQTNREIAQTQAQLAEVQAGLAQTQSQLAAVHASLRQTDEHLVSVGGTLGQTNPKLNDLDVGLERMKILHDVHASLNKVNVALGPLSTAMGSLGGAMSFLGMAEDNSADLLADASGEGGGVVNTAKPETAAGAEADAAGAPPGGGGGAAADASKRPDPLLGTWVLVYPPPVTAASANAATGGGGGSRVAVARVTVITADGKFLTAEDGQPPRTGRWSRQGRMVTFTHDAPATGERAAATAPESETVELLTLNSRTMTVRRGDVIRVHARP